MERARLLVVLAGLALGCAAPLERLEYARAAMGTEFRIVLYARERGGDGRAAAERAAAAAFERIEALDRALSDYRPESELSRLGACSDGAVPTEWIPVSVELFEMLALGAEFARASAGAFDVTVGPYSRLWRRARRQQELPEPAALAAAAHSVGYEKLELDPGARRVRLHARGMRLDLGGIAKGFALDEARAVLAAAGFERVLVVGGGELRAGAPPPGRRGWRVELVGLGTQLEELELAEAALATSGDLEQYLELDGRRHSHVLDPRTGQALVVRRLVSVLGPRAVVTDALATALSVLGAEEGLALATRMGVEARVLEQRADGIADRRTSGFPRTICCTLPATEERLQP